MKLLLKRIVQDQDHMHIWWSMLDAGVLDEALDSSNNDLAKALQIYGPDGRYRGRNLFALSHRVSYRFRTPGDVRHPHFMIYWHSTADGAFLTA